MPIITWYGSSRLATTPRNSGTSAHDVGDHNFDRQLSDLVLRKAPHLSAVRVPAGILAGMIRVSQPTKDHNDCIYSSPN